MMLMGQSQRTLMKTLRILGLVVQSDKRQWFKGEGAPPGMGWQGGPEPTAGWLPGPKAEGQAYN